MSIIEADRETIQEMFRLNNTSPNVSKEIHSRMLNKNWRDIWNWWRNNSIFYTSISKYLVVGIFLGLWVGFGWVAELLPSKITLHSAVSDIRLMHSCSTHCKSSNAILPISINDEDYGDKTETSSPTEQNDYHPITLLISDWNLKIIKGCQQTLPH